jgi:uncharacterized surface protein with fasciclin (FAS1) repeats
LAAGSFKTLVAAVQAADLVAQLKSAGPFTVFAPTDEAFAKVPKADLDALIKDKPRLQRVLKHHVTARLRRGTQSVSARPRPGGTPDVVHAAAIFRQPL